jgi:hypothetical protein
VVVTAEFQIRIAVWSLLDRRCHYLRGPKHPDRGLEFSPDARRMAVLEVRVCVVVGGGVMFEVSGARGLGSSPDARSMAVLEVCPGG